MAYRWLLSFDCIAQQLNSCSVLFGLFCVDFQNETFWGVYSRLRRSKHYWEVIKSTESTTSRISSDKEIRHTHTRLQRDCVFVCRTVPQTAVQLHSHADGGGQLGDGDHADVAGDDWRVNVVDDRLVGVFVALYHLVTKITEMHSMRNKQQHTAGV